nr:hypothetical protein [Providencia stuartii]ELR5082850.1 hypothetical protein [Providencia stuartii]
MAVKIPNRWKRETFSYWNLAAKAGGAAALAASIATGGAASATGLGAFQASMLSGQALSIGLAGARYNGGPVKGGSAYELGEKNLPELMQIGNKLIGIPGNNGRVFSYDEITGAPVIPKAPTGKQYLNHKNNERAIQNKDLLGTGNGGASLQVIIENHVANAAIEPRMEKGLTGEDVARIIITDMNEKGPIHRSVINNTTAGTKI